VSYEPTSPDEPRPAPPAPDVPNCGRIHSFQQGQATAPSAAPGADEPLRRPTLAQAACVAALGWFVFDVLSRLAGVVA
jgi:hypothetical protein